MLYIDMELLFYYILCAMKEGKIMTFSEAYDKLYPRKEAKVEKPVEAEKMVETDADDESDADDGEQ